MKLFRKLNKQLELCQKPRILMFPLVNKKQSLNCGGSSTAKPDAPFSAVLASCVQPYRWCLLLFHLHAHTHTVISYSFKCKDSISHIWNALRILKQHILHGLVLLLLQACQPSQQCHMLKATLSTAAVKVLSNSFFILEMEERPNILLASVLSPETTEVNVSWTASKGA